MWVTCWQGGGWRGVRSYNRGVDRVHREGQDGRDHQPGHSQIRQDVQGRVRFRLCRLDRHEGNVLSMKFLCIDQQFFACDILEHPLKATTTTFICFCREAGTLATCFPATSGRKQACCVFLSPRFPLVACDTCRQCAHPPFGSHFALFARWLRAGRTDDGQHLTIGVGEHVPVHGSPTVWKRQFPAVLLALKAASHHAGETARAFLSPARGEKQLW